MDAPSTLAETVYVPGLRTPSRTPSLQNDGVKRQPLLVYRNVIDEPSRSIRSRLKAQPSRLFATISTLTGVSDVGAGGSRRITFANSGQETNSSIEIRGRNKGTSRVRLD